jgi:hypothetical protein
MTAYLITSLASGFVSGLDNDIDPTAHTSLSVVQVASVLLGTILPIVVALVRKRLSRAARAWALAALSAISGFLTEFINNGDNFVWQQALLTTVVTFAVAVATYYGLWEPTGTTDRVASATSGGGREGGYVEFPRWIYILVLAVAILVIIAIVA